MKKRSVIPMYHALMILLALLTCIPIGGRGEELTAHPIGFVVSAVLPENQRQNVSYFDLLVSPSMRQTIGVRVENKTEGSLTFDIELNNAYSNPNGMIVYTRPEDAPRAQDGMALTTENIPTMTTIAQFDLETMKQQEGNKVLALEGNRVTIAPHCAVTVPILLALPEKDIAGQVLGGVVVTRVDEPTEKAGNAFTIKSLYSYTIALQLQETESMDDIVPAFELISAAPSSVVGFPALTVNIENEVPLVISDAGLRLRVYTEGESVPVIDEQKERISMAPLSTMPFTILLPDKQTLAPGTYHVDLAWQYEGQATSMTTAFSIPETNLGK